MEDILSLYSWLIPVIVCLAIWEAVWKLIALWRAARNSHLIWFIIIALVNTVGILPIIYILLNKKKK